MDSSFIDDVFMIDDDRHEEGRHQKVGTKRYALPEYMKFPCGLMCRSFQSVIPHRAVATV
jgi:hypothetical protein